MNRIRIRNRCYTIKYTYTANTSTWCKACAHESYTKSNVAEFSHKNPSPQSVTLLLLTLCAQEYILTKKKHSVQVYITRTNTNITCRHCNCQRAPVTQWAGCWCCLGQGGELGGAGKGVVGAGISKVVYGNKKRQWVRQLHHVETTVNRQHSRRHAASSIVMCCPGLPSNHYHMAHACSRQAQPKSSLTNQVLDGALAGHDGLHEEAEAGEHGKPPVLDLLHLELCKGLRVISQACKTAHNRDKISVHVHAFLIHR